MITGDLLAEAEGRMGQAVEHVASEFATVRTGRANPQILKRVTADYYGTPTPILQLASVTVPEPRLMVVAPYDPGSLNNIEKAISQSDLGLNPSNDGQVIRSRDFPLGVSKLAPGEAARRFREEVRPGLVAENLPAVLCGMIDLLGRQPFALRPGDYHRHRRSERRKLRI